MRFALVAENLWQPKVVDTYVKNVRKKSMKVKVIKDKRSEIDRKYDEMWNKLIRDANLNSRQRIIVANYLRELMALRIHEVESSVDMGWLIALIECEKFGTDVSKGAKRLMRCHQRCIDARNEAYQKGSINANGVWDKYDGCGLERLKIRLGRYGVDYDTNL